MSDFLIFVGVWLITARALYLVLSAAHSAFRGASRTLDDLVTADDVMDVADATRCECQACRLATRTAVDREFARITRGIRS